MKDLKVRYLLTHRLINQLIYTYILSSNLYGLNGIRVRDYFDPSRIPKNHMPNFFDAYDGSFSRIRAVMRWWGCWTPRWWGWGWRWRWRWRWCHVDFPVFY